MFNFTVDVRESRVDIWRHSTEHGTDFLWVIAVDAHSSRWSVLAQSPILIATEQVDTTVKVAQSYCRRVNTWYRRVDAELRQLQTRLRKGGYQLVTLKLPESLP